MAETSNSILQKLDGLEARFEEVSTLITDPAVIADQQRFVKLTKEYKDLGDIMDARKRYIACLNGIKEAKDILANETDPEMKEMAREELAINEELQPQLEEEIKIALIPKDPEDAKNVEMEIRAGTGGDEAALFAGDLFKMYKNYCESKGWQVSITYVSEGAVDISSTHSKIDFLITADSTFRHAGDRELPALRLTITLVHLEQVASKQTGFIATCSGTNLHLHILRILRILRDKGDLDFLFELWLEFFVGSQFLTGHLLHLRVGLVGKDILGLLDTVQTGDVTLAGIHDVTQVLVFLRQFHKTVLIGDHLRVSNQGRYFLEAFLQTVKLLQYTVILHN